MTALLTLAWIIVIIYATIPVFWLVIHPFAERWRRSNIGARPLLGGALLLINLATIILTAPWRDERLYTTSWTWLAWAVLFVAGAAMYSRIGHFGFDNLIGRTELVPQLQQRLVITGMHARVRHPIYLAHLVMLTAWTIGSGLTVAFALLVVALITGFFMIRAEDAELERRFGDEYRDYQRRVPAILPLTAAPASEPLAVPEVMEIFEQVVAGLPAGSAAVKAKGGSAVITPSNKEAAEIWGYGGEGDYIVGAGEGVWHEHLETASAVRELCRWIIAGNLKLNITKRGYKVVATRLLRTTETGDSISSSTIVEGEGTLLKGTVLSLWLNIFKPKTTSTKAYAPYERSVPKT